LAERLFGGNGLVFGLTDGASFGHRFLGINGMLVLGKPLVKPQAKPTSPIKRGS